MEKRRFESLSVALLVAMDACMLLLAYLLAYALRAAWAFPTPAVGLAPVRSYLQSMLIQTLAVQLVFYLNQLYHLARGVSRVDLLSVIFNAVSTGVLISIALSALLFQNTVFEIDYSRTILLYAWVFSIVLVGLGRWLHGRFRAYMLQQGVGRTRLVVVGTDEVAAIVVQRVKWAPNLGYELVGIVNGKNGPREMLGVPVLGDDEDLQDIVAKHEIDEVIISRAGATHDQLLALIARCQRGNVSIKVIPDSFEIMAGEVTVDDLGGLPVLTVRDVGLRGWRLSLKRVVDVSFAAAGLVLLSPVMVVVAVLIWLDERGTTFFVQERVGLDGKPFRMLKFRSMRLDAGTRSQWTVKDDPRRTRLGTFIRRNSIDELPQLINVLLGDMSLVGPRPEQPQFVEQFQQHIPRYLERHREKAGITGWAQVNGLRGDTSIEERTKYDLWYVEHWSLWLDIKILVRTVFQVLTTAAY